MSRSWVLVAVLLAGCGRIGFDDGGSSSVDARTCPLIWTLTQGAGTTPAIANGMLTLGATDLAPGCGASPLCSGPLQLTQRTLVGDFEVRLSTAQIAAMGGAFVQLFLYPPDTPGNWVTISIGPEPGTGNTLAHRLFAGTGITTQIGAPPSNGYTLRAMRSAGHYYASVLIGAMELTLDGPYDGSDLLVGIGLGNESAAALAGATSFVLPAFTVMNGGGAVVSDSFDCNSLP